MILYLAGNMGEERFEQIANRAHANHFLFTFAGAQQCAEYLCSKAPCALGPGAEYTQSRRIFIDSGAFSVWKRGAEIDLVEYIAFCKRIMGMAKCPVVFAALDVIAGTPDTTPTESENERACAEGWANYQTMKQEGISPCLMTFHQFDHRRWLTRIADDSDYFAVAPRKRGVSTDQKFDWLKQIFAYIQPLDTTRDRETTLKKKIHGLGVSSVDWMKELPFFSVDNTTWVQDVKAHTRRHAGKSYTLQQWIQRARKDKIPTRYLRNMLGYKKPGELPDQNGNSGDYWLMHLSMDDAVQTEDDVTRDWRDRGLILDHEAENYWFRFRRSRHLLAAYD